MGVGVRTDRLVPGSADGVSAHGEYGIRGSCSTDSALLTSDRRGPHPEVVRRWSAKRPSIRLSGMRVPRKAILVQSAFFALSWQCRHRRPRSVRGKHCLYARPRANTVVLRCRVWPAGREPARVRWSEPAPGRMCATRGVRGLQNSWRTVLPHRQGPAFGSRSGHNTRAGRGAADRPSRRLRAARVGRRLRGHGPMSPAGRGRLPKVVV